MELLLESAARDLDFVRKNSAAFLLDDQRARQVDVVLESGEVNFGPSARGGDWAHHHVLAPVDVDLVALRRFRQQALGQVEKRAPAAGKGDHFVVVEANL